MAATPYNLTFLQTRRAILGYDMNARTPGELDSWKWPGGDRNSTFWALYADKYDAEIAIKLTLRDPLEPPSFHSELECDAHIAKVVERLTRVRKQHERRFAHKIKKLTWGKLRRAQLLHKK